MANNLLIETGNPSAKPYINVSCGTVLTNSLELASTGAVGNTLLSFYEDGLSFSGNWAIAGGGGLSAPLAYSFRATRIGNVVCLSFDASSNFSVSSGSVSLMLSGVLPARLTPDHNSVVAINCVENSLPLTGECIVGSDSSIQIFKNSVAGLWTSAGTNSYNAFNITYNLHGAPEILG